MKGVIESRCPGLRVTDLTHEIGPQDVREGALFLAEAAPWFPPDTIHVAVVDPGVGTERQALALRAGDQTFIGPDNGLFDLVIEALSLQEARAICNPDCILEPISATFHGRDVFAPTAAWLAKGNSFGDVGPRTALAEGGIIPRPKMLEPGRWRGAVIHIDRFGNAITNVSAAQLGRLESIETRCGDHIWRGVARTYGDVAPGESAVLVGSGGMLEIAVSQGNAAQLLSIERDAPVEIIAAED